MTTGKPALEAIAKLHEQFEGWTIDSIEPSDKGDVGIKFKLSFGINNHATFEFGYSCCEGDVFVNGKEVPEIK